MNDESKKDQPTTEKNTPKKSLSKESVSSKKASHKRADIKKNSTPSHAKDAEHRRYKQLHLISTATLLEESLHLRLILRAVIAVAILVALLVGWSAFVKIKETAQTFGELVPEGRVQVVQHLEGGIVSAVLVKNGDSVKQGQLLVQFSPASAQAELSQLRSREISLILNSERLRAYLDKKQANLLHWSDRVVKSKYNTVKNHQQIKNLLEDEKRYLAAQNKQREDQLSVLEATLQQRKEQLKEVENQKKVWEKHIELLTKQFDMYHKLRQKSLIAHKDYLTILREMNKAKGEYTGLLSKIEQTKQAIIEAKSKLNEVDSKLNEAAQKELGQANDDLLEVRHKIEKLEDQLKRTNVRAPVAGTVKGLEVAPGNVVKPGGLLLEVVPESETMVAETRVNPRDIGHIKVGDNVVVKVLTYDYARYGSIQGKLINLSASTFMDKEGKPYYKATISLAQQYVGRGATQKTLRPGMTVEANVQTGSKTLLQYLLKPIRTSASTAFRER